MIPAAQALNSPLPNSQSERAIRSRGRDTPDFALNMRQSHSVDSGMNDHLDLDSDASLYPSHMEVQYEEMQIQEEIQETVQEDQEQDNLIDDDLSDPDYVPDSRNDGRNSRTSARVREREAKRQTKKTVSQTEVVPKKPAAKRGRRRIIKEEPDSDYFEDVES